MGCVLTSPVELIRVQRHGSASFRCAVAEMQGWRINHEDAHEMQCESSSGAFWVLDGHAGDGAALYGAPELGTEFAASGWRDTGELPNNQCLEAGFESVDSRLHAYCQSNPEKESGSTVVGALVSRQNDGSYSVKLLNCGDSRGLVIRGPTEEEDATELHVMIPAHLEALKAKHEGEGDGDASGDAAPERRWPLVAESVDHKPSHPTELDRIEAAGGHVTQEDPPRLDGNLAVSRGLGDFEYKGDSSRPVSEQKVSCVPDIYEVSGLKPGSICVLGCDGIWDVMTSHAVATLVRDKLRSNPGADLGDLAADLIRDSLHRNSRDNVTVMIVHFTDGSDWAEEIDEIKNYEKLGDTDMDDEVRKQYQGFLRKAKFPPEPCACNVCRKWSQRMNQCPCKQVYYCSRHCQKKDWKGHKLICSSANTASPTTTCPPASTPSKSSPNSPGAEK